jgi:hypothetical protein
LMNTPATRSVGPLPRLRGRDGEGAGTRLSGHEKDCCVHAHPLPTPPPQAGEGADRVRGSGRAPKHRVVRLHITPPRSAWRRPGRRRCIRWRCLA